MVDLVIIGSGPAGLSAAIYAARAGLSVELYEKADFGGVLPIISQLENYPGFFGEGKRLAEQMRQQAERSGAKLSYGECTDIAKASDGFRLTIDGNAIDARAVIYATGSEPRRLDFDLDTPVSYCALCDGPLIRNKHVAVIGGANSAAQEALYLSDIAAKVELITHSDLKADRSLIDRVQKAPNIEIHEHLEPTADLLNQFDYCFVYIGKAPATSGLTKLAQSYALLSRDDYILCDESNSKAPHQTVIPGLFAAGDVRDGATKQVITAAADGAQAAIEAVQYLKTQN